MVQHGEAHVILLVAQLLDQGRECGRVGELPELPDALGAYLGFADRAQVLTFDAPDLLGVCPCLGALGHT